MADVAARQPPRTSTPPVVDDGPSRRRLPHPRTLALAAGALYVPFTGLGYGTDVDITNVLRSGESLLDGEYRYSRPPGSLPYEALVGVLDRLAGPPAVALASAVAAVGVLVALAELVTGSHGPRAGRIAVVVVATQPWFWVAATSLGEYPFALGLLLAGVLAARADRRTLAGLAFATAIAFRSTSALLVGAFLLAELVGAGRRRWSPVLRTGAVTAVVGALWFVPAWLSVGRTGRFLRNEFETTGPLALVGRWGVKNIGFLGVPALVVLVALVPVLLAAVRRWRTDVLVRFAVLAAVAAELLFLRFPWKPVHLLPVLVAIALLLAASPRTRTVHVAALVASQLLLAVVSITVAQPDVANAATTGRLDPGITWGVVVNEVDCRVDPPHEGGWPDLRTPAADYAAIDAFTCQARSWRPGGIPDDYGDGASERPPPHQRPTP